MSLLRKFADDLGAIGLTAVAVLAAVVGAHLALLDPLRARLEELERALERAQVRVDRDGFQRVGTRGDVDGMESFYRYLDRKNSVEDWLAKLYGLAGASGIDLKSADYRLLKAQHRVERYQITLPLSGSYAHVRAFLELALAEVPILSIDQLNFRRKNANEPQIEADVVLTLHVLRP